MKINHLFSAKANKYTKNPQFEGNSVAGPLSLDTLQHSSCFLLTFTYHDFGSIEETIWSWKSRYIEREKSVNSCQYIMGSIYYFLKLTQKSMIQDKYVMSLTVNKHCLNYAYYRQASGSLSILPISPRRYRQLGTSVNPA